MTIILVWGKIISYTDPLLIFVFLEIFVISTISMAFTISVFFSKARLAAACAGIIYFSAYMPYLFLYIRTGTLCSLEILYLSVCLSLSLILFFEYSSVIRRFLCDLLSD